MTALRDRWRRLLSLALLDAGSLVAMVVWVQRAAAQYQAESFVIEHRSFTCVTDRPTMLIVTVFAAGLVLAAVSGGLAALGRRGRVSMLLLAICLVLVHLGLFCLRYEPESTPYGGGFLWSRWCSEG
ncbi:hypothetical protein AB0I55_27090 [Actinocatenispora sera]|uniref:hypothetical protein n=1 Tax=Actinocatenispora sera TaxID=390989 RepID=UPI0034035FEC